MDRRYRLWVCLKPCLEHEYIPEIILPVVFSGDMLNPLLPNGRWAEITLLPQPVFIQKGSRPFS